MHWSNRLAILYLVVCLGCMLPVPLRKGTTRRLPTPWWGLKDFIDSTTKGIENQTLGQKNDTHEHIAC